MAKSDDLSPLRKEFGLLLQQARGDLTQRSVAPLSRTDKPAIGTLSNWENGRHLPASQQELQDHLDRIDGKARTGRAGRKVPEVIRLRLKELLNQIVTVEAARVENRRLDRRHSTPVKGVPIRDCDAETLGVHPSITVGKETGLTPYLERPHDALLRERLATARDTNEVTMLVVVGGSCTGKTRTLYEAVTATLPDWHLTAPRNDTDLKRLLEQGITPRSVVWLDELQRHLTTMADGIAATKALYNEIKAGRRSQVVFVSTIWPANLFELESRPEPQQARGGGEEAPGLLRLLQPQDWIYVPDGFTEDQIGNTPDERLRRAIDTALDDDSGTQAQIIQVLAGGTQLIDRLYGHRPPRGFTQQARAVLIAAADLRRIGLHNPITRAVLEGTATAYLGGGRRRHDWFPDGLAEAAQAARADHHDIRHLGVPALVPNSRTNLHGIAIEAFDLHDYIHSDNLVRRRRESVAQALWDHVTRADELDGMGVDELSELAENASLRGLLREESAVLWELFRTWSAGSYVLLARLGRRGDQEALERLRVDTRTAEGRDRLAEALGRLADWGDPDARKELQHRAAAGDEESFYELCSLLVAEQGGSGRDAATQMTGFTPIADAPTSPLSLGTLRSPWRSRAEHLYSIGDIESLARLAEGGNDTYIGRRRASLVLELGRIESLRQMSAHSRSASRQLADYEEIEALDDDALRTEANRSAAAAAEFALRLCRRGELDAVEAFADQGNSGARTVLVRHLASTHEVDRLRGCVRAGYGYTAVDSLRRLYQRQTGRTGPLTLDVTAQLV